MKEIFAFKDFVGVIKSIFFTVLHSLYQRTRWLREMRPDRDRGGQQAGPDGGRKRQNGS